MKKTIILFSLIISIILLGGCSIKEGKDSSLKIEGSSLKLEELDYDEIVDKLIRFHVIANSDSKEDQELKLKVRDKVIDVLSVKLKDAKTLEEARVLLAENVNYVNEVAKNVIIENNYNYDIKTTLSYENFPDKIYGDYVFPQGNYEAFRVVIGSGSGQNWWCVMFPPLCFVDETKNAVDSEKLDTNIKKIESDKDKDKDEDSNKTDSKDDGEKGDNKDDSKKSTKNKVIFKSKVFEFVDELVK